MVERFGRFITSGWGDRGLVGLLMAVLENVNDERCYEYITKNMNLLHWASDKDWMRYRKLAKAANIGDIDRARVISELKKSRCDLLGVIISTPGGLTWLDKQIAEMKKKLGLE